MILHTPRLLLRPFLATDGPAIHAYASDPEVVTHLEWGPNTLEDTETHLRETLKNQRSDNRNFPFAIVLKPDSGTVFEEGRTPFLEGQLVGSCHLFVENPDLREAWIGYVLNRKSWGQGIMTEAARAILAFGFKESGLHRITATCRPENLGSQRVLEKIGMTREGHLRQHKWMKGQWRDSYLYAILEGEMER